MNRRAAIALLAGTLAGVVLAAVYFAATSGNLIGNPFQRFRSGLVIAALYAIPIALISALLWGMLRQFGRDGYGAAVLLGFVATLFGWVGASFQGMSSISDVVASGSPFAICGGFAGLVARLVGGARNVGPVLVGGDRDESNDGTELAGS